MDRSLCALEHESQTSEKIEVHIPSRPQAGPSLAPGRAHRLVPLAAALQAASLDVAVGLAPALAQTAAPPAAAASAPAAAASAPAARAATEEALQTVTVLGSRDPSVPLSNVPASITVVPREEISRQQP